MRPFIALILTLLLSGCAAAAMMEPQTETPTDVETTVEILPEERITYQVETIQYGDSLYYEETGDHLVTYVFDPPCLTAFREDGTPISERDGYPEPEAKQAQTEAERHAVAVTAAFNKKFEEWTTFSGFSSLGDDAKTDLDFHREENLEWHGGYTLELNCAVYQTDTLISVAGTYYSYTGGAHPNVWQLGWNFDLEEGLFFGVDWLAEDTDLQDAVTAEIIRQAHLPDETGQIPAESYWEDYEAIAANWSNYAVTFDEEGMTVVFSPYEIAAYAMGPQIFTLSYEFLEPHLSAYGRTLLGVE